MRAWESLSRPSVASTIIMTGVFLRNILAMANFRHCPPERLSPFVQTG